MPKIQSFRVTDERHGILRIVVAASKIFGTLLIVVAAMMFLGGIIFLVGSGATQRTGGFLVGVGATFLWSLGVFVAGIQTIAVGSFFLLAIQVEENTRATAQALERLRPDVDLKKEIDPHSFFLS